LPFKAGADVCLSTYTMLYLPLAGRLAVTQQLVVTVRRRGSLMLQCPHVSGPDTIFSQL
jgi:hypothetical protein